MKNKRIQRSDLTGKIIDVHSHVGLSVKAFAGREYPYASTIEGLYYRQQKGGVDINVVFPFTPEMYLDVPALLEGHYIKSQKPLSACPYATENQMLVKEIFDFCPELSGHFLPFVSIDPGRDIQRQIQGIQTLMRQYPIYGIKINPVLCQSPITDLLTVGKPFLELAHSNNWPFLLHTTVHPEETYSRADLAFKVIEQHPELRFCLAHCIGFHKEYLHRADQLANVWVDTAALTIQVQLAFQNSPLMAVGKERFDADYSDHTQVMHALAEAFPNTIMWGSDSPAYSYICRRKQAEGVFSDFRLKATYEDEVAALNCLPHQIRQHISNNNTINFIF